GTSATGGTSGTGGDTGTGGTSGTGGDTGTGGTSATGGSTSAGCATDSTARPKAIAMATTASTGPGTMTLSAPGCTAPVAVAYADGRRAEVPAPSLTDFFVQIDPTNSVVWYPGVTQVVNFFSPGTGDDEEAYLAPRAGTIGSVIVEDVFPAFDAAKAHALIEIRTGRPSDPPLPCELASDLVVSVPGHPEAVVHYLSYTYVAPNQTVAISSGATASVAGGGLSYVSIEGITPGDPVTFVGTKTGCKISPIKRPQVDTGKMPLVAGRVAAARYLVGAE
ncbi:MAG: hypothetical protein FJ104_02535, partial [Deltaproteobacteria bacterium]|nr:hypothetical protein [Deltaproteobacteria bacterium]